MATLFFGRRIPGVAAHAVSGAFVVFLIAATARPAVAARVQGSVLDADHRPIAGARAELQLAGARWAISTDQEGRYVLDPAATGEATLLVSAAGFPAAALTVTVTEADMEVPPVVLAWPSFSDEIVVVASGTETRLGDTAASVVALPAEQLFSAGATTLDGALRQVPGFALFRRSGSRAANPTTQGLSLRGVGASGASRALVLDDGIPLNDPFGGWVYWARVPRAAVGRVEVLRGGGSDLYGSGGVGGVLQVLRGGDHGSLAVEASYGSQGTPDASASGRLRRGAWSLVSSAEAFRTDGYLAVTAPDRGSIDAPVTSRHSTLDVALEREAGSDSRAFVRGAYFEESRDNGTPFQTNDTRLRQLSAGLDARSGEDTFTLRGHVLDETFDQTFSAVAADRRSELPLRAQRVPSSSLGIAGRWSRGSQGGARVLAVGAEWTGVKGETDETILTAAGGLESAGGRQGRAALFAASALPFGRRLRLTAGARLDAWRNHDGFRTAKGATTPLADREETALSPRLSLLVRATDRLSLAASAYRAFRAPTLNELYRSFRVGNVFTAANENLQAERLKGIEAGALAALSDRARLRANLFWMDLDDTVANVTLSAEPNLITRQRQNLGRTRSRGLEVDAEARAGRAWALSFGYLFADATVVEFAPVPALEGNQLPQVPRHSASLQVRHDGAAASIGVQVRWTGDQFEDDQNTLVLRAYWSLDAEVRRGLGRGLEVFVGAENLTGARCDVGRTPVRTVGPPRSVRAGLRLRLGSPGRSGAAPASGSPAARGAQGGASRRALRPEADEDGMAEQPLLGPLAIPDLADDPWVDPGVVAPPGRAGAGGFRPAEGRQGVPDLGQPAAEARPDPAGVDQPGPVPDGEV
jgi:outer membrane receptor protein involved in Fe transport